MAVIYSSSILTASLLALVLLISSGSLSSNVNAEPKLIVMDLERKLRSTPKTTRRVYTESGHVLEEPLYEVGDDRMLQASQNATSGKIYHQTIVNSHDYQYHGFLYMGERQQEMSFILDTGSSWMWVPGERCPNPIQCAGETFKSSSSATFFSTKQEYQIQYGMGSVAGTISRDQVAFMKGDDPTHVAQKVYFLNVYRAQELSTLVADGLLGLGPGPPPDVPTYVTLVDAVHREGMIPKNMYSLYLTTTDKDSKIWFGGYDHDFIRNNVLKPEDPVTTGRMLQEEPEMTDAEVESEIAWVPLTSSYYWQGEMKKVLIGGNKLKVDAEQAIFDSGSSLTHIPSSDYADLIASITAGQECYERETDIFCKCTGIDDDSFPTLYLFIGTHSFKFESKYYLMIQYGSEDTECYVTFREDTTKSSYKYWLLGDPFLRAYFSIYDGERKRVGFIGNTSQRIYFDRKLLIIPGIICFAILFLVCLSICCTMKCCKERQRRASLRKSQRQSRGQAPQSQGGQAAAGSSVARDHWQNHKSAPGNNPSRYQPATSATKLTSQEQRELDAAVARSLNQHPSVTYPEQVHVDYATNQPQQHYPNVQPHHYGGDVAAPGSIAEQKHAMDYYAQQQMLQGK